MAHVALVFAFVTLLCLSDVLPARAGGPEELLFAEIPTVVTPARTPQRPSRAPAAVEVFTWETIERWGVRSLADLLRRATGVDVRQAGYTHMVGPRATTPELYMSHLLVLIDGIPVNDPIFGRFDMGPGFPLEVIRQVEVVRGAGSCLYGANAFGGVVNIITRRATDGPGTRVKTSVGPDNGRSLSFTAGTAALEHDVLVGGRFLFTDGRDAHAVNDNDFLQDRDGWVRANRGRLDAFFLASGLDQGRPLSEYDADPDDYLENRDVFARASWTLDEGPSGDTMVHAYSNRQDGTFPGGNVAPRIGFDATRRGLELITTRRRGRATTVAGLEYASMEGAWYDLDGSHETHERAAFLQQELPAGLWTLTLGARLDDDAVFGSNLSPRFSALRPVGRDRTLRLTAGRAYRSPNFSQLYIDAKLTKTDLDLTSYGLGVVTGVPVWAEGNPDLEPELVNSYDATWRLGWGGARYVEATAFLNRASDRFGFDSSVDLSGFPPDLRVVYTPVNTGRSSVRGLELSLHRELAPGRMLLANWTWQQAYDRDTGETLSYSPLHKGNLGLDVTVREWTISGSLHIVGQRLGPDPRDPRVVNQVAGFGTVDMRVARALNATTTIALDGYNLLDKRYYETEGYPSPGRTVFLEFVSRF